MVRESDSPRGLFGVVQARTRHVCAVGEDREVLMHVGGPGLWTGEYPLLSGARSIGSVIADAPTLALHLSPRDWQRIVAEEPRWLQHFAALLAVRFATAYRVSRQTLNAALSRVQQRGLLRVSFRMIELVE
jgi:CRP-like cAMP-binding protein